MLRLLFKNQWIVFNHLLPAPIIPKENSLLYCVWPAADLMCMISDLVVVKINTDITIRVSLFIIAFLSLTIEYCNELIQGIIAFIFYQALIIILCKVKF